MVDQWLLDSCAVELAMVDQYKKGLDTMIDFFTAIII